MDEKNLSNESLIELSQSNEASYEGLLAYFSAKRKIYLGKPKGKNLPLENTLFLQACSKLYNTGPKLFSESNYELLKQHPKFAEEIVVAFRPAVLKAVFGNYIAPESVVENIVFILSVLHKNGIIENHAGKIKDQDWIRFLNALDPEKLDQYAHVFSHIDTMNIADPGFFARVKAHNDLDALQTSLLLHKAYKDKDLLSKDALSEDTQIKGFTLINEYVCKRTRFFPKPWKQAMRIAWEDPSIEASFELYKLYAEQQIWLDRYINFPIIYSFLSYFYSMPIFQTFNEEPLTKVCRLLQSVGELNMSNFNVIADMPQTALLYCELLNSKGVLNTEYLQNIKDLSELTLQNICEANKKQLITTPTLKLLIRLGKIGIDGTTWMIHKPSWLIVSKLSDNSLKTLGSLELNEQIFGKLKSLYDHNFIQIFDRLSEDYQQDLLTNVNHEKITTLLQHLEEIGLFTPENIKSIFDNQARLIEDSTLLQSILNLEKSYVSRDQKKFERVMQSRDRSASRSTRTPSSPSQPTAPAPATILSTLPDEQIARHVSKKLKTIGIAITEDELEAYSPAVLHAFYAVLPLLNEDNLLTQTNLKSMLRLFSAAPDPQIRCRCMIIMSQCGLLILDKLTTNIGKLEFLNQENPALFREIYAEAWVQTESSSKWLQQTISAGTQETDLSLNAEETLIQRFLIENEENSAYLALEDIKHRIASHERPPLVQQAIKLLDKSKLSIQSILDDLLQTNEEQLQKVYAWLFILDKAGLLDSNNAKQIIRHRQDLAGDVDFLKTIVTGLKAQPEFKMNTALKQKNFDQLLSDETSLQTKQKILEYINLSMRNPSAAAKLAYMASDVADVAGEKAVVVQGQLKRTAGVLAAAATDVGQKVFDKIKLFSSKTALSSKPTIPELLSFYSAVASQSPHFNGSFYQTHLQHLNQDLNALLSQDLLSEPNVKWLVQQPNQESLGRGLRLLAQANMLKDDDYWQNKISILSAYDSQNLTKLESKCRRVLSSQESPAVKENTVQMWLEPLLRTEARSNKKSG